MKKIERLFKELLQALILATPIKIAVMSIQHVRANSTGDCGWCIIISLASIPLTMLLLCEAEYIFKRYIVPLWTWIWSEEEEIDV